MQQKHTNQRRKEIRAEVGLLLPVTKLFIGDSYRTVKLDKILLMEVVNISASGALLYCSLDIPKYVLFQLELSIDGEKIPCIAKIVRKEKSHNGFYYGCAFTLIMENSEETIRKFVFRKQMHGKKSAPTA